MQVILFFFKVLTLKADTILSVTHFERLCPRAATYNQLKDGGRISNNLIQIRANDCV